MSKEKKITKAFNTKYVICGNVIKKYVYEKPVNCVPNVDKNFTKNDTKKHDDIDYLTFNSADGWSPLTDAECELLGVESISDKNNRLNKISNKKKTLRRARTNIIDLINSNSHQLNTFITLTFEKNITKLECANSFFHEFCIRAKKIYKNFKYIAVIEFQKRGAVHYHMLCNIPVDFKISRKKSDKQKDFEVHFAKNIWTYGFVDIRPVSKKNGQKCDNVGAYVTKYMTKTIKNDNEIDERFYTDEGTSIPSYLRSHNLDKPIVITFMLCLHHQSNHDSDYILPALTNAPIVRNNTYISDYLGKIIYIEYNQELVS